MQEGKTQAKPQRSESEESKAVRTCKPEYPSGERYTGTERELRGLWRVPSASGVLTSTSM